MKKAKDFRVRSRAWNNAAEVMAHLRRTVMALIWGGILLTGCASDQIDRAPFSASVNWTPNSQSSGPFTIPDSPRIGELAMQPAISESHEYSLPELIDMAQMNSPDTRIAWQQARQAALAVGMAEATFLPIITASVIGGYQKNHTPLQYGSDLDTTNSAVVPGIVLQWLVFDFGQRSALVDAAKNTSFAVNFSFNGMHQKLIFDVTRTYFLYGAARSRVEIAQASMRNSEEILDATLSRRKNGLATTVEVAQSTQLVAQSKLNRVLAQGAESDARQALLGAIGISPLTRLNIRVDENKRLPAIRNSPTEAMISRALSRRPDILASYSALQAATSVIKGAESEYFPKVFLAGSVAGGHGSLDVEGLPSVGAQTSSSNIVLGVSVPLYDGGIRTARLQEVQSRASAAEELFRKTQEIAVREIVTSDNALRSALESNDAAYNLVSTARTTYDAALDAYQHGVGTVTVAKEAANSLLAAQQMHIDAYAGALIAAANLAFAMGEVMQTPLSESVPGQG